MIAPSSYGALSATSANTIKGSAPWFTGQSGAKKLGFKVNGTTYSESLNNINPNTIKEFNAGLKLRDFTMTSLTATDFNPTTDYYDADGDAGYPTAAATFSMGSVTYDWYENGKDPDNDAPISVTNQTLGCGSGLSLPLTLKITLPNVKVKSRYGNPNESSETNLVQKYKIGTATGICFAKPKSLDWWSLDGGGPNSGNATPSPTIGGGYNSDHFDPDWGFKASLSPAFPTTGFVGAEFTLVMVGSPTDYTFTHNGGTAIILNTTTGKVTLNSKPSGAVTITATKSGTSHHYSFNPTLWVEPKLGQMPYTSAISACGGANKIPSQLQLTSKRNADYFTRAVGGGVFGEWGDTNSTNYPSSQWSAGGLYWTRDPYSSSYQYLVLSLHGGVTWYRQSISYNVVCLG
ncbi:hypothetical protein RCS94_01960 [Orbaceae bacterium ac157xtp]